MASEILHTGPVQAYRDIRPSHTRELSSIKLVLIWMCHIAEIHYSGIIVILAGKDNGIEIIRMNIGNSMLVCIPSSKAQIKSAHESDIAVYQTKLFVMRPV